MSIFASQIDCPKKRDAKDVVPYKIWCDFYVLSVGEDIILPFIFHQFDGRGDPSPTNEFQGNN